MNEEEQEFKKECDEKLYSIYSKIDEEEKIFLSYLVNKFNNICERNNKAIDWVDEYMDEWDFHDEVWQDMNNLLILLKGDKENEK